MPYKDPEKAKEYKKKWRQKNKEKLNIGWELIHLNLEFRKKKQWK